MADDTNEDDEGAAQVDLRFRGLGMYFLQTIESLRDVHSGLSEPAAKLDDLSSFMLETNRKVKEASTDEERAVVAAVFESVPEDGLPTGELIGLLWEATENFSWGPDYVSAIADAIQRRRRAPLFHGAMLTSFVSSLEAHFSVLAREYFNAAPEALHDLPKESAKEFSLRDIQAMSSIEDAVENAIESRIAELSFGNLAGWRAFFKDRMKIDLAELGVPSSDLREIFERRNCVVHHDGRASKRYINSTNADLEVGDLLSVTDAYAQTAVDAIELLGIQLHVAVWRKFTANVTEVTDWVESASFNSLKSEQWKTSLGLYETWRSFPITQNEQLMAQVNLLLAKKGLRGLEETKEEIEHWDVSGLDDIYTFAKLCLLDDLDAAFDMVPSLVERNKLGGWALATWPLTKGLRSDSRIHEYAEEMKEYLSESAQSDNDEADDGAFTEDLPTFTGGVPTEVKDS